MPKGNGNAFGIIAILLGASGLGLGLYLVLDDQDPIPIGTLHNVIGLWESIEGGPAQNFYLEFEDIQINESAYFNITGANRNITLTQQGWYRFNLRFIWQGLSNLQTYYVRLYKNGSIYHIVERVGNPPNTWHAVDESILVYSDGDDVFSFQCYTTTIIANTVGSQQEYNQFVVEYVKEV